jgi:hypothetical protein
VDCEPPGPVEIMLLGRLDDEGPQTTVHDGGDEGMNPRISSAPTVPRNATPGTPGSSSSRRRPAADDIRCRGRERSPRLANRIHNERVRVRCHTVPEVPVRGARDGEQRDIGPPHLTRQICRSRALCEYAECARTRAQIICARTSGRRAVGPSTARRVRVPTVPALVGSQAAFSATAFSGGGCSGGV